MAKNWEPPWYSPPGTAPASPPRRSAARPKPQRTSANRSQSPGTPSVCALRGVVNSKPEPMTRSPGRCPSPAPRPARPGQRRERRCGPVMPARSSPWTSHSPVCSPARTSTPTPPRRTPWCDGLGASDGRAGPVEGRDEAVTRRHDLLTVEPAELSRRSGRGPVVVQYLLPPTFSPSSA